MYNSVVEIKIFIIIIIIQLLSYHSLCFCIIQSNLVVKRDVREFESAITYLSLNMVFLNYLYFIGQYCPSMIQHILHTRRIFLLNWILVAILLFCYSSLVMGLADEKPSSISFVQDFEAGSCLSIAWSSGRIQYFPIIYTDLTHFPDHHQVISSVQNSFTHSFWLTFVILFPIKIFILFLTLTWLVFYK